VTRKLIFGALSILAAGLYGSAAGATTLTYKCTFPKAQPGDWIQPLIFVAHDTEAERVVVSDGMILAFNDGHPVEGRVIADNHARITFGWTVDVVLRVSPIRMAFRGTYVKATEQFSVSAQPYGYESTFSALGDCTVDIIVP
jgi:hypothetical protein